jgi:hypothetical protein
MLIPSMDSSTTTQKRPWLRSLLAGAKPWLLFVSAILASVYVHELGHCAVAWLHGYPAIPTPAKEYILKPMPEVVRNQVSLGGVLGSVAAVVAGGFWFHRRPSTTSSALLAGAMTVPGVYTLRFVLEGRGHDGTEFQEAQAALGLSYPGHALDHIFYGLLVIAAVFWFCRTRARPTLWLVCRLLVGAVAAVAAMVWLQSVNNAVFDPLFEPKPEQNQPVTSVPRADAGRAQLGRESGVRSADSGSASPAGFRRGLNLQARNIVGHEPAPPKVLRPHRVCALPKARGNQKLANRVLIFSLFPQRA